MVAEVATLLWLWWVALREENRSPVPRVRCERNNRRYHCNTNFRFSIRTFRTSTSRCWIQLNAPQPFASPSMGT
uniref:Putative secreted peptide n=1 Tax=Anopheles braziliensis TaxID=58242 RepID=A0A2M3ZWR4_9DIPT